MNDYEKQAKEFLTKTKTSISVKFKTNDYYFMEDNQTRDIYNITLKNEKGKYSFTFGQSIHGTENGEIPNSYDILACLEKYEVKAFKDFCEDFGYNDRKLSDCPKVMKIYKACKKQYEKLTKLFTDEEMEELRNIQ
jgi:hypothetical protein